MRFPRMNTQSTVSRWMHISRVCSLIAPEQKADLTSANALYEGIGS
jgi:hypothetical protein